MSASPTSAAASAKRPLEDSSSPTGPTDQPDAKRPALDKVQKTGERVAPTSADGVKSDEPKVEKEIPVENGTNGTQPIPSTQAVAIEAQTQPIQSTASDQIAAQQSGAFPPQDETNWIHIRAVISSAEAATAIGKGGENVSQIRRMAGAKCTVSDYSRGAVERILTVSGAQDAVAKVCFPILTPFQHLPTFLRHLV